MVFVASIGIAPSPRGGYECDMGKSHPAGAGNGCCVCWDSFAWYGGGAPLAVDDDG